MDYQAAHERVQKIKKLYKSIIWFAVVALFLTGRNFYRTGELQLPNIGGSFILSIWAVIIAVRAAQLFIFDGEWENEMIKNEISREKKKIQF